MNKIITIIVAALLLAVIKPVKSQNIPVKYVKGWGTELNFNPFDGSLSLNNTTGQIKVRRFIKNDIALRGAISIAYKNNYEKEKLVYGQQAYDESVNSNSLLTALNLGAEKHFNPGHRLSPYLGFEIGMGLKISKQEIERNSKLRTVKGAWETQYVYYNGQYYEYELSYDERGYVSGNGNLLTGFDYYVADNFYFGYELGFGVEFTKFSKIEITKDEDFQSTQEFVPDLEAKSWRIGPRLQNGIRIGYNF